MAKLDALYRHPVKSLGEEALAQTTLTPGRGLPFDRSWAVALPKAEWDPQAPGWLHCRNFVTQRHVPALAQLKAAYNDQSRRLRLTHPDLPNLDVDPDDPSGANALTEWLTPLSGERQPGPYRLCRLLDGAFTDGEDAHVSIGLVSSRDALGEIAGVVLAPIRFRMNLWVEGLEPWAEFDLVDREMRVGSARLKIIERCERCNSTTANPLTGESDVQVPSFLRAHLGHLDFGVLAQVVEGGTIQPGDPVEIV